MSFDIPHSAFDIPVWWAIHTRPRAEKRMEAWLKQELCPAYLPLRAQTRLYTGKRVTFLLPLFPGYTFGAFTPFQSRAVLRSGHAAALLQIHDQAGFLQQLDAVRRLLDSGQSLQPHPYLGPGRRIRVATGKFRGLEGTVIRQAGRTRLVVSLDFLQRSVLVELDPGHLALAA
jgi:hypothetical protein